MKSPVESALIVEDDAVSQQLLATILKSSGVKELACANSYETAFGELKKKKFSVILLDHQLSTKEGLCVLEDLRKKGNQTPVLLLSGALNEDVISRAAHHKHVDFLSKPFQIAELNDAIHRLMA